MTRDEKKALSHIQVGALCALIALSLGIFFYFFYEALPPFLVALAIAYLLDPITDRLEQMGLPRVWAASLLLLSFITLITLLLILITPLLASQLIALAERMPSYIQSAEQTLTGPLRTFIEQRTGAPLPALQESLGSVAGQALNTLGQFLRSVITGGQKVISLVAMALITPIIAFYLLLDWDHLVAVVDDLIPHRHRSTARDLARQMDAAMAGFLRGQSMVCVFLALWYSVGLTLLGLNFGLAIGLFAGLMSFIPFLGVGAGLLLAGLVSFYQFWPDWYWILATFGVFASGQFLEGNFLQPRLVGASVGLHPVWLMFAVFAFGMAFGFVGLLVAVPVAACAAIIIRAALERYRASTYYGEQKAHEPGA